ncbi:MAG: glutamyl-tRNA reductase [Actinomycetia bacterium]|nr:glutamyl-tRNA reductase [Actinomycetes bacterium]
MSLLIVGISHQSAPMAVLESVALDDDRRTALQTVLHGAEHLAEVVVLSTCNRTEVYVDAATFHGALSDLTDALSAVTGVPRETLREHLYVHYEDRAVEHAFTVAAGLDSMAVGESQILGQLRSALAAAQQRGHVGATLNVLLQQALRVGKRVHTETEIDAVSRSLVEGGLAVAETELGGIADLRVLVLGAGGMGALAAATAHRLGAAEIVVVNRSLDRAERLAARVAGTARPMHELDKALAAADVVIASTGAVGTLISLPHAVDAQVLRAGRPQVYLDLALPHDVATEVGSLTGVRRLGLADLATQVALASSAPAVSEARRIVTDEVAGFRVARAGDAVAPAVAALRRKAAGVVTAELRRLQRRTPELSATERTEVEQSVHRIVEKLLHAPTTRAKELAHQDSQVSYAAALAVLFDLPEDVRTGTTGMTSIAAAVPDALPQEEIAGDREPRPGGGQR